MSSIGYRTSGRGFTGVQAGAIALLRVAIGWHLLYEGVAKLRTPGWSAAGYLEASRWLFAEQFHRIASSPAVLRVVDSLNIWLLIITGLGLTLGLLTRLWSVVAMLLLALYWVANPPLVGVGLTVPTEGGYLVVDKNAVEFFALALLLVFGAGRYFGVDGLVASRRKRIKPAESFADNGSDVSEVLPEAAAGRRQLLASLGGLPFLGAFAYALFRKEQWKSYEVKNLVDAVTAASSKTLDVASLSQLKGKLPMGEIKGRPFSRLILGGNLLSGYTHARDLIYVSHLVKAYHTRDRIFATLLLAEKCGVNTLLTNPILCTLLDEYWKRNIGRIQFISDCAGLVYKGRTRMLPFNEYLDRVQRAIDYGACACYIQGESADWFIRHGQTDNIGRTLDLIRKNNVIAGIGAHDVATIKACVQAGFEPDFWMKTLHHHNYWSAKHPQWHDNVFCKKPDETIAFMRTLPQPWIGFKVLAAGAIRPDEGFRYAFENGADFLCVGMYDFQMVADVNTANEILAGPIARERPWRGGPLVV
ncbi:MAG: DoxX family membrane protein [Planctomycetes bacterium]|nr:DoxX family membrane protein [Planctomycetota bacterium]